MAGFDDVLNSFKNHNALMHKLGYNSAVQEFMRSQVKWRDNYSGISMLNDLRKTMLQVSNISKPYNTLMELVSKKNALQYHSLIPSSTYEMISSINRQHQLLFSGLDKLNVLSNLTRSSIQINSLRDSLAFNSGKFAALTLSQQKWDLIDDFEEISSEAVSLQIKIIENKGITTTALNEIRAFFEKIEFKIDKIDTNASSVLWRAITIICFLLAIASEVRNWLPEPDYATKEEIEEVLLRNFSNFESKLKSHQDYRITNRSCRVTINPKVKSATVTKLPYNFELIVLQINHKWVYVSYINPSTHLPQTGWIPKKYLNLPN